MRSLPPGGSCCRRSSPICVPRECVCLRRRHRACAAPSTSSGDVIGEHAPVGCERYDAIGRDDVRAREGGSPFRRWPAASSAISAASSIIGCAPAPVRQFRESRTGMSRAPAMITPVRCERCTMPIGRGDVLASEISQGPRVEARFRLYSLHETSIHQDRLAGGVGRRERRGQQTRVYG